MATVLAWRAIGRDVLLLRCARPGSDSSLVESLSLSVMLMGSCSARSLIRRASAGSISHFSKSTNWTASKMAM
jgi:hypothetical protein